MIDENSKIDPNVPYELSDLIVCLVPVRTPDGLTQTLTFTNNKDMIAALKVCVSRQSVILFASVRVEQAEVCEDGFLWHDRPEWAERARAVLVKEFGAT